jgi:nicotinamidase-related amidase
MPITTLDERTALVLIDLQRGITWLTGPELAGPAVTHAARLAGAFRARDLPVILVRVNFSADGADAPRNRVTQRLAGGSPPPDWAEIIPELGPEKTDILVTKRQTGAFYGTDLDLQLRRRGVTGIVLGGIMTSLGVESTARAAYDHGYNVTFASDAMADPRAEAHRHSLEVTFPVFGEVGTSDAIIAALPG